MAILVQMAQAITTQAQVATIQAQDMTAQANREVLTRPQEFIDEVYKILLAMGLSTSEKAELATYQLKDVAQAWEMRKAKVVEFINLRQGVSSPVGEAVVAKRVYRNCPIMFPNRVSYVLELDMLDFDITLGKDWLHACFASSNYRTRVVRFNFPNEPVVDWKESISIPRDRIISCLNACKIISKSCPYHIVRVQDLDSEIPPIDSVPVVSEFPDAFPNNLTDFGEGSYYKKLLANGLWSQKSYVDHRRSNLEFEEGDKVYLKILRMKGVVRFGKKGNMSPRYVCPYEILQRVGKVAYELGLPSELAFVYPAFHVSMLKKCVGDPDSILPIEGLGFNDKLSYEEVPIQILDSQGITFGKKGKLSPRYVGPNEILQNICKVAYELRFPSELNLVHPMFHVSVLKKCIGDPESILPIEGLAVQENLSYEDVPAQILDRQVHNLRNKEVASVKVSWNNHLVEGATWEVEADMKSLYPHIFDN
ncbi:hypothetical protein EJD97_020980 [Solanum chilense]|uniref:Tf2-1-like SH3-like domain-containing protein n=1 Tax=Solanum chilense TaxID=4083 RepID=A0A6N2AYH6_SOLCI|nr:hypothetical protein EJD97_020980 [Solanum chilense]